MIILAAGALVSLWSAPLALAMRRVYWANYGNNTISFANLDGSGGGGRLSTRGARPTNPNGVAIDLATATIYWANRTTNTISFARLNGTGGGRLNTHGASLNQPRGVAIDVVTHKIYWTNFANNTISFANDNGSGRGGQLNTAGATVDHPQGLAIDHAAGKIYWTNQGDHTAADPGSISFVRINGTGGGRLNTAGATLNGPTGLAIDSAAGRLYWANQYNNTISFARLNGSGGGGELNTAGATLHNPVGAAIDPVANRIYWANVLNDTISFARLDGSGGGQLNTTGATLSFPNFPGLLVACVVPRLNGKTLRQARALLRKNDCRLGKVSPKGRTKGKVNQQSRKPGRILPASSAVDIKLRQLRVVG